MNLTVLNFRKTALAAGLTLVLGGCALAPTAVSPADLQKRQQAVAASDRLIVPEQRIGPIHLDMSMDAVTAALGAPDYTNKDVRSGRITWAYESINLNIEFASDTIPYAISIITLAASRSGRDDGTQTSWEDFKPVSAVFKTASGLGLGASSEEVVRVCGPYHAQDYDSSGMFYVGIDFDALSDHRIWCIEVNRFRL